MDFCSILEISIPREACQLPLLFYGVIDTELAGLESRAKGLMGLSSVRAIQNPDSGVWAIQLLQTHLHVARGPALEFWLRPGA
jgi:hypothetical protein